MDTETLIPISYISQFFNVPADIILIIVLLSGYVTLRLTQKYDIKMKDISNLDKVFLLSFTGLTWFIRIALIVFWIYQLSINLNAIKEYEGIPLGYVYGLILYAIISTNYDVNTIRNKSYFKKISKYKFFEKHRFTIAVIISMLFAFFLSYGVFSHMVSYGIEGILIALFYLFLVIFCVTPMISILTISVKKLTQ